MASFNLVVLVGNLTRDPETRFLPSGTQICEASIAINEKWTKDGEKHEKVHFFDLVIWAKAAETFAKYMAKGRPVLIHGKLVQDRWEKDGEKKSRVRVHVDNFQFLGDGGKREEASATTEAGEIDTPF